MPLTLRTRNALSFGLMVAGVLCAADQITKLLALELLQPYTPVALLPVFNLTLAFNPGAAFSFLATADGWQRWLLSAVALAVSGYLVFWLRGLPANDRLQAIGLGLILGGAIGNLIDRLRLGEVIDFLDLHYAGWHWPAFNLADSGITIGVLLVLICALRDWRRERKAL